MKLELNTILFTKDGRVLGNAIITEVLPNDFFRIKTDYGNDVLLSKREIKKNFRVKNLDGETLKYMSESHKHYINKKL